MITRASNPIKWEQLISILDYSHSTGIFTWKESRGNNAIAGQEAGSKYKDGYIRIYIGGRHYLAHRLAWLYCFKEWPTNIIDHINGIRSDNRLDNLQDVTTAENNANRGTYYRETEYSDVYAIKHNLFIAEIKIRLGEFSSKEEAYECIKKYREDNS